MRRPVLLILTISGLLAGLSLAWRVPRWGRTVPDSAVVASPPRFSGMRTLLTKEQQTQAAFSGGFVQIPLSLLNVDKRMSYGDSIWNDTGVPPGPVAIRVDLRTQILSVFRGGHEIGTAVILYGADAKETPIGHFPILWKGKNHRSSIYDVAMPYTLRLTGDGVAIHGSDVRWGAATHGCIGVPTDFANHLYAQTAVGDSVEILRSDPAASARQTRR